MLRRPCLGQPGAVSGLAFVALDVAAPLSWSAFVVPLVAVVLVNRVLFVVWRRWCLVLRRPCLGQRLLCHSAPLSGAVCGLVSVVLDVAAPLSWSSFVVPFGANVLVNLVLFAAWPP